MAVIFARSQFLFTFLLGIIISPSVGNSNPKVAIRRAEDDEFHADIATKDGQINLRFKRAAGIFSRDFAVDGAETDPKEWIDFEKRVMVADNGAVAHIDNGELKFLLDPHNGIYIKAHDSVDPANQRLDINTYANSESIVDYVDLNLKTTVDRTLRQTRGPPIISVKPEVHIVIDMAFYKQFNGNDNAVKSYLSMFFHAVNNRYQTLANPKISFVITKLTILKVPKDQPFIEIARIKQYNDKEVDMSFVLREFATWTHKMKLSQTADLVALISAEDFMDKDTSGKYRKGVAGVAYLGGACRSIDRELVNGRIVKGNKYLGTSVTSDQGVIWSGVFTLAHELAHNLNANHDPTSVTKASPSACQWKQGYLMSYEGYGTPNKFKFSQCSASMMLKYLGTVQAQCLRKQTNSEVTWNVNTQPGETLNMDAQCEKIGTKIGGRRIPPQAIWKGDFTAKDVCLKLSCTVDVAGYQQTKKSFRSIIPLDMTPCNAQNHVCRHGSCTPK